MQSLTVLELLLKVHGWQGGTIWQAFRELKPEHKQKIKDLAFCDGAVYTVKTESAFYSELMEFIK
ncbi:hypothetical protein HWC26_gp018 [Aeromonas phage 2L372X]|uniref:Uncharacterized protein n=2 Tax=Plateaulakevirus TaxID=2843436 RepID=A0A5B9N8G2_9CAUD|nr:hypothetical protein HWC25_gp022 [Aeromonas phage 2L372D]YP_009846355.1 hypothetical protein HWC26_gp018 [Aeromonas phage 2L372X]QDB73936.1 hypothetical protein 2L372D_022 [Aeromonas phage 2L372D]QEG08270.1 hypothetical protein [Aeromonas phage 2L372X]